MSKFSDWVNSWHYTKNKTTFKEAYQDELKFYKKSFCTKWRAFWGALDAIFEGHYLYDFYWHFIWCPIYRFFHLFPKFTRWVKHIYQRTRYGVSEQDCWGFNDRFVFYILPQAIRNIIKGVFGKDALGWTDERWEEELKSWDDISRRKWNKFVDLLRNVEGYEQIFKNWDNWKADNSPESQEQWKQYTDFETNVYDSSYKNAKYIVSHYLDQLWW